MAGTFANGQCYANQYEAATAYCSEMFWSDSAGASYACNAVANASAAVGGGVTATFTIQKVTSTGAFSSRTQTRYMYGCEPYGAEYFAPIIAAWWLALVVVLAARAIYTRIFNRES